MWDKASSLEAGIRALYRIRWFASRMTYGMVSQAAWYPIQHVAGVSAGLGHRLDIQVLPPTLQQCCTPLQPCCMPCSDAGLAQVLLPTLLGCLPEDRITSSAGTSACAALEGLCVGQSRATIDSRALCMPFTGEPFGLLLFRPPSTLPHLG